MSVCFYMYLSNFVPRPYCAWLGSFLTVLMLWLFQLGSIASRYSRREPAVLLSSRRGTYMLKRSRERDGIRAYISVWFELSLRLTSVRSTQYVCALAIWIISSKVSTRFIDSLPVLSQYRKTRSLRSLAHFLWLILSVIYIDDWFLIPGTGETFLVLLVKRSRRQKPLVRPVNFWINLFIFAFKFTGLYRDQKAINYMYLDILMTKSTFKRS